LKDCENKISQYDLCSLIIHHGSSNGGHYTAYARNHFDEEWYEYDDSFCRQVDSLSVQNSQAYVLFYRKKNFHADKLREEMTHYLAKSALAKEKSMLKSYYVSKQWLHRLKYFSEPGPIDNIDFLCTHSFVYPYIWKHVDNLTIKCSNEVWNYLVTNFNEESDDTNSMEVQSSTLLANGDEEKEEECIDLMACNYLYPCKRCMLDEEAISRRQFYEKSEFIRLRENWNMEQESARVANTRASSKIYAINVSWFKKWEQFVQFEGSLIAFKRPGPIDNLAIASKSKSATGAQVTYHLNPSKIYKIKI
jgi:ubiquitin carboxyl-terminal hydrolase 20/33